MAAKSCLFCQRQRRAAPAKIANDTLNDSLRRETSPLPELTSMKLRLFALLVFTALLSFAAGIAVEKQNAPAPLDSHIYRKADARKSGGDWGSIYIYTPDTTATHGTDSMLTAELEFLPGKRLQPPHLHPEEEFQYIIEGTGTWFLNGKETPIQKGDLMYAKPGDLHGISNTSAEPLRFFVVKWNSKGVEKTVMPGASPAPASK
jgi:mannose-6-phosphate isomerase-like protein (cupin superfamily)